SNDAVSGSRTHAITRSAIATRVEASSASAGRSALVGNMRKLYDARASSHGRDRTTRTIDARADDVTSAAERREMYVAAAIGVAAILGPAAIAFAARFDGLYGQDPYGYYDYAIGPLRDSLTSGHVPPPTFWPLGY